MRDLINHDDEITCPNCQGVGRVKKPTTTCPECLDTGFVGDNGAGKRYNNEYHPCDACEKGKTLAGDCERKICELSVNEFKKLWIECYEELEQHKLDTSMEEYKRLTTKQIVTNDISTRDGKPVPKEW